MKKGSTLSERIEVGGRPLVATGTWLRLARVHDEIWMEEPAVPDPKYFIRALHEARPVADLFTFAQALPDTAPKYAYPVEWDNISVAQTLDYEAWWTSLPQESRKNVRRSERRGVSARLVEFSDELAQGIKRIYDETPVRQGRQFWHYRKPFEVVRVENSSYLERSQFIGAYHGDELIGFLKMVYVRATARIMQILSMNSHLDKRPTNALLAKAVETCSQRRVTQLIYGQHVYDNRADSPVTEFKRRNGFEQVLLPRYFIPLTTKGRLGLSLGLHRGWKHFLPPSMLSRLLAARARTYARKTSLLSPV